LSGRYKKAPLIYMMSRVKTASLPKLTSDQIALRAQILISLGYIEEVNSLAKELGFNFAFPKEGETNAQYHIDETEYKRVAYFDESRKNVFIFDSDSIEFRTTAYTKFEDASEKIQHVIEKLSKTIPVYKDVLIREISLTYVDMIFPIENRDLGDYLDSGTDILPLSIFKVDEENDVTSFGSVQVTRVVEQNKRIVISLEQLPISDDGYPTKIFPNRLVERDTALRMKLDFSFTPVPNKKRHYAILTTESGTIVSKKLDDFKFLEDSDALHMHTSTMFKKLVNKDICDIDWEFTAQ